SEEASDAGTDDSDSDSDLAALQEKIDAAAEIPDVAPYFAGYGDKVENTDALQGKKIMIIPGNSQIPACVQLAGGASAFAEALGRETTVFANSGATSELNSAVSQAINSKYDAIITGCSFDPKTIGPAISQAADAGIPVVVYGATLQ